MPRESWCSQICQIPYSLMFSSSSNNNENDVGLTSMASVGDSPRVAWGMMPRNRPTDSTLSLLQKQDIQTEKRLEKYLKDDLNFEKSNVFDEIGGMCDICDTHVATHYALPCHHVACRVCWARWLNEHSTCMVCIIPVSNICRYPLEHIPLQLFEVPDEQKARDQFNRKDVCINVIEESIERCTRSILFIKDRLGSVLEAMITIESHMINLMNPQRGTRLSIDELTSVLAVEQISVIEQFEAYENLFASGKEWDAMDQEISNLASHIRVLAAMASRTNLGDEQTLEVLQRINDPLGISGQWSQLRLLLARCGPRSHLVPNIAKPFGLIDFARLSGASHVTTNIPVKANHIMAMAQGKEMATDTVLRRELFDRVSSLLASIASSS